MKRYYDILNANCNDSIETIHKKYKIKARQWHPDMFKDEKDKLDAEEKFKEVQNAFTYIKKNHSKNKHIFGNINNDMDFKNFTEKLINKGNILHNIINNAKNIDLKDFFNTFFIHIKKFRFLYDDMFSDEKLEDIVININVSLNDIFNKEDKIIELDRIRKCDQCYDLKFCSKCNNKSYLEVKKSFVFNCSDKIIVFPNEGHQQQNKKTSDIILKIHPKHHSEFKLINNYDIYYEIYTSELTSITHSFTYLNNEKLLFETTFPYKEYYIIENKGLPYPYSNTIGHLIIKIIYKPFTYLVSDDVNFSINYQ